jgi:hypothetical protein
MKACQLTRTKILRKKFKLNKPQHILLSIVLFHIKEKESNFTAIERFQGFRLNVRGKIGTKQKHRVYRFHHHSMFY